MLGGKDLMRIAGEGESPIRMPRTILVRTSKNWLRIVRPNPEAALRLFCFPWAGGTSSAFSRWGEELSPRIEVCAVQLPGREDRLRERPCTDLTSAAEELTPLLERSLDRPFASFGHSLAAPLAFEVARLLRARGRLT